jgi:predicted DNA-binding protein with PD1-like motif
MEFGTWTIGKVHILRVDPGEDILEMVERFLQETGLRQAVVLGGYGTMAACHLHWVMHNKIPSENLFRTVEGGIEILAMNGLVVDGKPHIHVALAMPDGGFGGHLEPGCIAYVLCEIFFAEIEGAALQRKRVPVSIEGMGEGTVPRLIFPENK